MSNIDAGAEEKAKPSLQYVQGIALYGVCPGYCVPDMKCGGGKKTAAEVADKPV